ncbi:MAG: ABC transporter substrate-binding protein [Armatimonadota bacterium]|nr:ABC transporter substrate-binding protein [Armatimonadota bacterium]
MGRAGRCLSAGLLAVVLAAIPMASGEAQPRRGGVFRMAHIGEPPTLDLHLTTAVIVGDIMLHVYEGLFALTSTFEPRPMLVDTWKVSPDRLTYTFTLRRGVRFHHGRELTSDDVVASLTRWGRLATRGRALFSVVRSLGAPDPHTVVLTLKEPYGPILVDLGFSLQGAAIYPKEVIEEAGAGPIRRYIGTGPYRFVEHLPDRHVRLDRFDGYSARSEAPDGFTGRKAAYLDTLIFVPVPDVAVRIAGVARGDYHFADSVPQDEFPRLQADPNLVPFVPPVPLWLTTVFNKRTGPFVNPKMRQAWLAALDMEAVMRGTFGHPRFWRLDPALLPKPHYMWTDVGRERYNQRNPERARQWLAEAGYRGEPIKWMTTMEYPAYGISAQIARPMLERAGFVFDFQVVDWATLISRRTRPDLWDALNTAQLTFPDPTQVLVLNPTWPGWYESRDMQGMMTLLQRHTDPKVRMEIWRRAQRLFWEEVPAVKYGDYFLLHVHRKELRGYVGQPGHAFWNAWLEGR